MEASLPISAGLKPSRVARAVAPALSRSAPSVKLPLAFMLMGLASLSLGVGWLVASPTLLSTYHYNQSVISATHLLVLGWICSIVMGAMYQLVPVALETKLYSERLAKGHFFCHAAGVAGMVWMFKAWNMKQVGHYGSLLALGVGLFVYNIVRTLMKAPKWTVVASAITAALAWFSLAVTAGLCVAAGKCLGDALDGEAALGWFGRMMQTIGTVVVRFDPISTMHAHAHLGGLGFFTMLIVGVSYKLIPMFTLSEIQNRHRAGLSVALLNIGLAGSFFTILLRSAWKLGFTLMIVAALALYGVELAAILRARKRRVLDWGLKGFLTAIALLVPLSALAIVLSWPGVALNEFTGRLENLYGFLALAGFVTLALIGMLYKIIPFLVWFGTYSKKVGLAKVPMLADLYSERLQVAGYFSYLAGIVAISAGILGANEIFIRAGGGLFAVSVCALLTNVVKMLGHFANPRFEPLSNHVSPKV
jgi:cbb3-type cytochrome oxidase subunit 1